MHQSDTMLFISGKKWHLATVQLPQVALTDVTDLKTNFLFFLSAIFYTGKSKETCNELFFMHWYWIGSRQPICKFEYRNLCREGKNGAGT